MGADGEDGIEQQHALPRPRNQAAVLGLRAAEVVMQLLEDVDEGTGQLDAGEDRKTQAVGLADVVVGILSEDNDTDIREGGQLQSRENVMVGRKDFVIPAFGRRETAAVAGNTAPFEGRRWQRSMRPAFA